MADDIQKLLKSWGFAHVNRFTRVEQGATRKHTLDRARDFAPGTKERAARQLIGRSGKSRRRRMAAGVGIKGLHIVQMWVCDPVPSKNDASPPKEISAAVDQGIPEDLRWIDRALSNLQRVSEVRVMVLREEYCGTGTQTTKARRVAEAYGGKLSVWQYRRELQRALDYLEGRSRAA